LAAACNQGAIPSQGRRTDVKHLANVFFATAVSTVLVCHAEAQPKGLPLMSAHGAAPTATANDGGGGEITGKVVETMDAASYTYVLVDDGTRKLWAAAPKFAVAVGDQVKVPPGQPLQNFESKTLNRSFDVIYFVERVTVLGEKEKQEDVAQKIAAAHAAAGKSAPASPLDFSNLQKAAGGQTVAEVFANKAALAGKEVTLRGKVAKFTRQVMGKNWIHIQDGTGGAGTNDLTLTTSASAAVGNTVLVRGKLSTDRDFGFGYKYDVLIEDAAVTVE
jgi:hypothetical protein